MHKRWNGLRPCFAWLAGDLGCDPRWMEAGSAITALIWSAFVVLGPEDLADRPGYHPLAEFAPDWVWVVLMVAGALVQFAAARRDHHLARLVLSVAMGTLYLLLMDGLRIGSGATPTLGFPLGLAVMNAVSMAFLMPLAFPRLVFRR